MRKSEREEQVGREEERTKIVMDAGRNQASRLQWEMEERAYKKEAGRGGARE